MAIDPEPWLASRTGTPRGAPLPLRIAGEELILLANEANMLLDGIDSLIETIERQLAQGARVDEQLVSRAVIQELDELAILLERCATRFSDPPLSFTPAQQRHLRHALADLAGYHRSDLPPGLLELRARLS